MEKVLLFQVNDSDADKIRNILGTMKIRVQVVAPGDFMQTLGNLAEGKKQEMLPVYTQKAPDKQIRCDYKAILTPFNKAWNVLRLYAEMAREKAEYSKQLEDAKRNPTI